MLQELIGTIIGVTTIFWVGLEIGSIVGRASTLIDIKGTDAYFGMIEFFRSKARKGGIESLFAKGMLHILNEAKEEGIY